MAITSANQLELLQTAEAVAREKMIDPGLVVEAMEESLARAAKSRYGAEMDIRVSIDRKTGKATFTRVHTVVEDESLENYQAEMTVQQAKRYMMESLELGDVFVVSIDRETGKVPFTRVRTVAEDEALENYQAGKTVELAKQYRDSPEAGDVFVVSIDRETDKAPSTHIRTVVEGEESKNYQAEMTVEQVKQRMESPKVCDVFVEEVPPVEMGRIAAQSAKQLILQKVREAERDRQFEEFKDRANTIINGAVKREEFGSVIVDLGGAEAVLRRNDKISRESYRPGDRIRAYVKEVRREVRGHQIFLSRTATEFMAALFKMEVPEIYDGIIEVKAVARDPGSRAKIAVISYDDSIDPVGACVGMRGSRVQAVVNELQGEKIDIIPWNEDQPTFLVNALQPAEVSKVVLDEEAGKIEVVVPEQQLSLAIGRRGQNVRLASQLTGLDIDIMTEAEESARRQKEFEARTRLFMESLDLDEFFAQLLVSEGFTNLEEVAYVEIEELLVIDGVDEGTARELQTRAREFLEAQAKAALESARALGAEDSLIEFEGLTPQMVEALAKDDVKTLEDFATCADWELAGGWTVVDGERIKDDGVLEPFGVLLEEAQNLVMTARIMLGWVDPTELEQANDGVEVTDEGVEA